MDGTKLAVVVGLAGITAIVAGTALLYADGPPPRPDRPKAPPPPESLMNSQLKYSPTVYRGLLEEDARKYGVPIPLPAELALTIPYFEEVGERRRLKVRESLVTPHLKLYAEVAKQQATLDGQTYATNHLVLKIENKTNKNLAYRVLTDLPDRRKCLLKGEIPHTANVIEPKQTIVRTECLYHDQRSIDVMLVEVMEVPPLSAVYVSRLPANSMFYDQRVDGSHVPLRGGLCPQTFSWREIQEGLDRKEIGWRDVMDFYARHNCDEYAYFRGYHRRTDPGAPLPAKPGA